MKHREVLGGLAFSLPASSVKRVERKLAAVLAKKIAVDPAKKLAAASAGNLAVDFAKKLVIGGGLRLGDGARSSFGAAPCACACAERSNKRLFSWLASILARFWLKFSDVFVCSGVRLPILWGLILLQIQGTGDEGSQLLPSKHTPTPLVSARDTHIVPPLPHSIFYPMPKLIAILKIAPENFTDFFSMGRLNRILKGVE